MAKRLGIDYKTAWLILVRNDVQRRSRGRPEKYPKTDFRGDLAEQARMCGFINDCGAVYNGKQICVSTATTHPAQVKEFNDIFVEYGHIGWTPRFNKQFSLYYWQVYVYLRRPSFDFLVEYKKNQLKFLRAQISKNGTIYVYIGSLTDAEGCVGIHESHGYPIPVLGIANNNRQILEWTQGILGGGIGSNSEDNTLQLRLYGEQAVEALRKLPLTHEEKVAAKRLILRHYDDGGIELEALREYQELRRRIDDEVRLCRLEARLEWIRRHGRPRPDDPDQSIPQN